MQLKEMICLLLKSGMTETELAQEAGCSQSTINRAKKGADTGYSVGRKIEAVYARIKPSFLSTVRKVEQAGYGDNEQGSPS